MSIELDPTECRVLGSLVEKQLSVPEAYPLTLNSLVLACNQKSNRDPAMEIPEYHVQGALRALRDRGWVHDMELAGARTIRYAHRAADQLGVDEKDLAILAELWLRGPQSPQELRARASRMRPFTSPEEVENRLRALSTRPVPYVRFLGKRPGERAPRWAHSFGIAAETAAIPGSEGPLRATEVAEEPAPRQAPTHLGEAVAALAERVSALESEVARLRARAGG